MCAPLQATEKCEGGRVPLLILRVVRARSAADNRSSRVRYLLHPHFLCDSLLAAKHFAEWVGRYSSEQFIRRVGLYFA
jgi:hypothetical protein